MIAPFASLAFLIALWLVAKFALDWAAADGGKIAAALAGHSMLARPPQSVRAVSVRYQPRAMSVRRPLHASSRLRDAA